MIKKIKSKIWWIVGIIVILGIIAFSFLQEESIEVETTVISKGTINQYIIEEGKVILDNEFILTMPVNGEFIPIDYKEGFSLKRGQKIGRVDNYDKNQELRNLNSKLNEIQSLIKSVDVNKPKKEDIQSAKLKIDEIRLQLEQIEKQKQISRLNFNQLEKDLQRQKNLSSQDALSKSEYENTLNIYNITKKELETFDLQKKSALKNLEEAKLAHQKLVNSIDDNEFQRNVYLSQIEQINTQKNIINNEIDKGFISSPITGKITQIFVDNKMFLPIGSKIINIGDMSSIIIETDILSEEINKVNIGQKVEISGKALENETIIGKVIHIFPTGFTKISALGVEQQRVKVNISFDNSKVDLLAGTSIDLKIITDEKQNVLMIPEKALFKDDGKWYVFTVNSDNKAEKKEVTIGLKNDQNAEIISGLSENQILVSETDNKLKEGIVIKNINDKKD